MKPGPFSYVLVDSVPDAVQALSRYGPDARILAGGQSLVPAMNLRLVEPRFLIDINPVRDLDYISSGPEWLAIGALTRHRTLERSETVRRLSPLLAEAVRYVGYPQVRNRGTVGGSFAHNDPSAEYPVVAVACNAQVVITGPAGNRVVPAQEFFRGYFTTALQPAELLTEVRFPAERSAGYAFLEFARRAGDFAIVTAAAMVDVDAQGRVTACRVVLGNVAGGVPYPVKAALRLVGQQLDGAVLADFAEEVRREVDPDPDGNASAAYKKQLASVLARRALELAVRRARKEGN
jgi:carbon-monoxide dehydrogenase medium subunit